MKLLLGSELGLNRLPSHPQKTNEKLNSEKQKKETESTWPHWKVEQTDFMRPAHEVPLGPDWGLGLNRGM